MTLDEQETNDWGMAPGFSHRRGTEQAGLNNAVMCEERHVHTHTNTAVVVVSTKAKNVESNGKSRVTSAGLKVDT